MLHFHVIILAELPPWSVTFERAYASLEQLPGVFIEPDGSFFRSSRPGEPKWQVEGTLYDQGQTLSHVELKGCCPAARLDELLRPLGGPEASLLFQMARQGTQLTYSEFRTATQSQDIS